jgi:hypothetical protein
LANDDYRFFLIFLTGAFWAGKFESIKFRRLDFLFLVTSKSFRAAFFNYFVVKEERKKNVVNHMEEKKKFEKV